MAWFEGYLCQQSPRKKSSSCCNERFLHHQSDGIKVSNGKKNLKVRWIGKIKGDINYNMASNKKLFSGLLLI